MTLPPLTSNALKDIFSSRAKDNVKTPMILQVTNIKQVESRSFRVLLFDGVYSGQGLVDESCGSYLKNNGFTRYQYIQVNDFSTIITQRHIVLLKNVEILGQGEKSEVQVQQVESYFKDHPEDDYLAIQKQRGESGEFVKQTRSESPFASGNAAAPAATTTEAKPVGPPVLRITPIETISPYQNNWTIKARVSYKGDLRTWTNAKGTGQLFSVNFLDESDEIKATAFNETAEKLYKLLEEGKVYYISKARVTAANKKFNHLTHPYEINLEKDTEFKECFDNAGNVPKLHFNFVKLDQIQALDPNSIIDVIGVLKTVNEPFTLTAKSTGKVFDRRNITIVDKSGFAIEMGLWNNTAVDFNIEEGTIIAFKGCKVQDFNGRSLTLTQQGSVIPNPVDPLTYELKGWYDNQGINESFKSLKVESSTTGNQFESRKLIAQAQEENLGKSEKPDYFTVKATISFTKPESFAYPACPNVVTSSQPTGRTNACNRKLVEQPTDGTWRCERCDINYPEPTYRYIFNCAIMDESGQIWITLFDNEAKKLFAMEANELIKIQQETPEQFNETIASVTFKEYQFRLRARQDTYNDQLRVRYQAVGIDFLDYNAECEFLCKELDQLFT
ncbi:Replication factor A protein 1 [Spathaspora sp. JA1]|nr:Replication factor A protein 1 [Spathaspora sp. JA1]